MIRPFGLPRDSYNILDKHIYHSVWVSYFNMLDHSGSVFPFYRNQSINQLSRFFVNETLDWIGLLIFSFAIITVKKKWYTIQDEFQPDRNIAWARKTWRLFSPSFERQHYFYPINLRRCSHKKMRLESSWYLVFKFIQRKSISNYFIRTTKTLFRLYLCDLFSILKMWCC